MHWVAPFTTTVIITFEKKNNLKLLLSPCCQLWFFHFRLMRFLHCWCWLIYLKKLVSQFSNTFDCLWYYFLRSNSDSFVSFLIHIRIIFLFFAQLCQYSSLPLFKDLFLRFGLYNLLIESLIHKWSVVTPDVLFFTASWLIY